MLNEQVKLIFDSFKIDGDIIELKYCRSCKKTSIVDANNPVRYVGYCSCNEPLSDYDDFITGLKDINEELDQVNEIEDDAEYLIKLVSYKEEYENALEIFKPIDSIYQEYLKEKNEKSS